MSTSRIDPTQTTVQVDQTRARQTAAPATPFKDVLAGGANALMTGAEIAGGAIGGPVVAAAIRESRNNIPGPGGGGSSVGNPGGGGSDATTVGNNVANSTSRGDEVAQMQALNKQNQTFNLQLLRLQEDVQNENRRFTTLSNVIRSAHDTAKAATGNIRS